MRTPRPISRLWKAATIAVTGLAVVAACTAPTPPPDTVPPATTNPPATTTTTRPPSTTTTTKPPSTTTTTRPPSTTTTTRPPSTTTTPSSNPLPVGPAGTTGSWSLKFSDDFSGTSVDTSKWNRNWFASSATALSPPINDAEESCYDPANVSVSDGALRLSAKRLTSTRPDCRLKDGSLAQYSSGLVHSDNKFNFSYGYSEARIRVPGTATTAQNWMAFWTTGQDWPNTGEIDIVETLEGDPTWSYHWGTNANYQHYTHPEYWANKPGNAIGGQWVTYGVEWAPGKLAFYYNGKQVGTALTGSHIVSSPHFVVFNYGLSTTDWAASRIDVPATMEVDYVRVWQR